MRRAWAFYPTRGGGKYHVRAAPSLDTAKCRGTVLLDVDTNPIIATSDQQRFHPVLCHRCIRLTKEGQ